MGPPAGLPSRQSWNERFGAAGRRRGGDSPTNTRAAHSTGFFQFFLVRAIWAAPMIPIEPFFFSVIFHTCILGVVGRCFL